MSQITCTVSKSYGATSQCRQPAVLAKRVNIYRSGIYETGYEPVCKTHAAGLRRRKYENPDLVELTPEVVTWLEARAAAIKAREDEAKAARKIEAERRYAAAVIEAEKASKVAWTVVYTPDTETDWTARTSDGLPATTEVPKWSVRDMSNPDQSSWYEATVKVIRKEDFPVSLEVRNPSSMTVDQAIALANAIMSAVANATRKS